MMYHNVKEKTECKERER